MDTVPGNKRSEVNQETQKSTISRYSCRIVVDREAPHTARVYAAGFDKSSNIFLGVCIKPHCHVWAIQACAAVKGMVFKQFTLG